MLLCFTRPRRHHDAPRAADVLRAATAPDTQRASLTHCRRLSRGRMRQQRGAHRDASFTQMRCYPRLPIRRAARRQRCLKRLLFCLRRSAQQRRCSRRYAAILALSMRVSSGNLRFLRRSAVLFAIRRGRCLRDGCRRAVTMPPPSDRLYANRDAHYHSCDDACPESRSF